MIKAIPTVYRSVRFRSRAEARYAVFMDFMGIKWEYEQQGFTLDGAPYLPDFYLPEQDCYIEIKGAEPTPRERFLADCLAEETGKRVYLVYGGIDECPDLAENSSAYVSLPGGVSDVQHWWCECEYCGLLGLQFQGRADRLWCKCYIERGINKRYAYATPKLLDGYAAARSARFEHGERGAA